MIQSLMKGGRQHISTRERMHSQKIYFCTDESLMAEQTQCLEILYDFNHTRPSEGAKREEILKELLGEVGENCYIEPPLHANWGRHTHLGNSVYANFNLTLVDDTDIFIGDYVMIGQKRRKRFNFLRFYFNYQLVFKIVVMCFECI